MKTKWPSERGCFRPGDGLIARELASWRGAGHMQNGYYVPGLGTCMCKEGSKVWTVRVCEKRSNMAGSVRGGRGEARAALRGVPQGLGQGGCVHLAGPRGCCNAALLICVKQGLCSSGGQLPSTCCKDQRACSGPPSLGRQQPKQEDDRDALDKTPRLI